MTIIGKSLWFLIFSGMGFGAVNTVFAQDQSENSLTQLAPEGYAIQINNVDKAQLNWMLNCQGCHKVGAIGLGKDMPNLNGSVSSFLKTQNGIEYIGRVNGIANAPLSNADLADLINWMFVTYDAGSIPVEFAGYTPEQVGELRKQPWGHTILDERSKVVAELAKTSTLTKEN